MKKKFLIVDYPGSVAHAGWKREWQKEWYGLGFDCEPVQIGEGGGQDPIVLFIVHGSGIPNLDGVSDYRLTKLIDGTNSNVAVVISGGFKETQISNDARISLLSTSFPRESKELLHLQGKLNTLIDELGSARTVSDRIQAWHKFDAKPITYEKSFALSVLCQGYLGNFARDRQNAVAGGAVNADCAVVGKALLEMGWIVDEAAMEESPTVKELFLNTSEANAELKPGIEYWTSPFGDIESLRRGLQSEFKPIRERLFEQGQKPIQKQDVKFEWETDSELPKRVALLINAIETGGKDTQPDKLMCMVAQAYLELNQLLDVV